MVWYLNTFWMNVLSENRNYKREMKITKHARLV